MVKIQFSSMKKIKIGCTEHSLTPHPLHPITSHFCFTFALPIPHQLKRGRHMCIAPNRTIKDILHNFILHEIITCDDRDPPSIDSSIWRLI